MEATESVTTSETATPTPAAPATSAPAATITPAERPTFAQAFARDAAAQTTPPAADPGTATTAPAAETSPESAKGPIPFEVHKTALENARTKATEQVRAELQQQYGWTQGLDQQTVKAGMQIGELYQRDRVGFIRQVMAEALTDESLAPMVRSEAARALGQRRGPETQAPPDLSPDIPVMDGSGQIVAQTFSADRVKAIVSQAVNEALGREVAPMKKDFEARQQQQEAERVSRELQTTVNDTWTEVSSLPGFEEHKAEIAKVFESIPGEPAKALRQAWKQVVGPKLGSVEQVKAQTLKELQTKAAASTASPTNAASATTKRPTSFHDKSLQWS